MAKVNCSDCENWTDTFGCKYQFRMAANAGGAAVDCKENVWFCQDYDEKGDADDV